MLGAKQPKFTERSTAVRFISGATPADNLVLTSILEVLSIITQYHWPIYTVEEEHAIQIYLFINTSFHSRNIFQVIAKKHTHTFLV